MKNVLIGNVNPNRARMRKKKKTFRIITRPSDSRMRTAAHTKRARDEMPILNNQKRKEKKKKPQTIHSASIVMFDVLCDTLNASHRMAAQRLWKW